MTDFEYVESERRKTAEKLKNKAAELAAALEEIAHGTDDIKRRSAQAFIKDHVDHHWFVIILGNRGDVSKVLANDESDL
jgi:hypothetical protein